MEPHPNVQPLTALLGQWAGEGAGTYPTIEPFRYREEIVLGHVGKPFLSYRQATVNLGTGLPAHSEAGYIRATGADRLELVLAHPTGVVELAAGTYGPAVESFTGDEAPADPGTLRLVFESTHMAGTETAKEVTSVRRVIDVTGDVLRYRLSMAAVGQPHQHHLEAELHRDG